MKSLLKKTGCKAIWVDEKCRGKDKRIYSYAKKPDKKEEEIEICY